MTRYRPTSRSQLLKRGGIALLVVFGAVVSLFPTEVKNGVEAFLSLASSPDQVQADPAPKVVRDPTPERTTLPPPPPKPKPRPIPQPVRRTPPKPTGPPRAMVVAIGDSGLAPRLGSLFREALDARGVEGVEGQENSIRLDEMIRDADFHPRASAVEQAVREEGCTVLVLIRGDAIGTRKVSFYGRNDVATKWRVRVSAHDLRTGRGLGPGWGGELETTERGAVASLDHFVDPISDAVAPLVAGSLEEAGQKIATAGR